MRRHSSRGDANPGHRQQGRARGIRRASPCAGCRWRRRRSVSIDGVIRPDRGGRSYWKFPRSALESLKAAAQSSHSLRPDAVVDGGGSAAPDPAAVRRTASARHACADAAQALEWLGEALHLLQDSFSSAHIERAGGVGRIRHIRAFFIRPGWPPMSRAPHEHKAPSDPRDDIYLPAARCDLRRARRLPPVARFSSWRCATCGRRNRRANGRDLRRVHPPIPFRLRTGPVDGHHTGPSQLLAALVQPRHDRRVIAFVHATPAALQWRAAGSSSGSRASAAIRRNDDMTRCSGWLASQLQSIGLQRVRRDADQRGIPSSTANGRGRPASPTVLIYGHYDVQPAEPVQRMDVSAVRGRIHGGYLHGRGASDDKGQLFAHVKAIESLLARPRAPARQREMPVRGRGGDRQPESACRSCSATPRRSRGRRGDVRHAGCSARIGRRLTVLAARAASDRAGGRRASGTICTPAISAARSTIRCRRCARSSPACTIATDASPSRASTIASAPWTRTRARLYGAHRSVRRSRSCRSRRARAWGERGYSIYERLTLRPSLAVTGIHGGHTGAGPRGSSRATPLRENELPPRSRSGAGRDRAVRASASSRRVAPPTVRITRDDAHPIACRR